MYKRKPRLSTINLLLFFTFGFGLFSLNLTAGTVEHSLSFFDADVSPDELNFLDPSWLETPGLPFPEEDIPDSPVKRVPYVKINRAYWKGFWSDTKYTFSAPFRWKGLDWAKLGVLTALTAIVYANDDGIMSNVQKGSTSGTARVARWVEKFGNPLVIVPGLLLTYGYGKAFKRPKLTETALLAFKSAVISTAVVHVIKFSVHRHRPSTGPSSTIWDGPSFDSSNLSFPSGHSTAVFSIASVVASQYKKPVVGIISYSIAILTAISRVHDRKHWGSDVLFGGALGFFIGKGLMSRKKRKDNTVNTTARKLKLFPLFGLRTIGVGGYYTF